jgi:hypothetical protein
MREDAMRNTTKALMTIALAAALAACGGGGEATEDQNIAIDNATADVDVLPPDESVETPTNALVNGTTDDPDAVTADNQTDSY